VRGGEQLARDFFEAYIACLCMFLIPVAIIVTFRIRSFIGSYKYKKEMEKSKEEEVISLAKTVGKG
jgi:hypothetical protein